MKKVSKEEKTFTTIDGKELVITRDFNAPRELVFKAWTDPKHLPQWFGPEQFTTTVKEINISEGGVWRYTMHGPDGTDYDNKITFLEINSPASLLYAHGDSINDEHFRVSVSFEQIEQTTRLTMKLIFKTIEELEQTVNEFAIEGAKSTLERLHDELPKITLISIHDQIFKIERIFNAPRELVFKAFTEAEHLEKWWGPRGWILTVCNIDFRPGGSWHYCMKCVDEKFEDYYGFESWGKAIYQEIIKGEKIRYIDYFSDAEGIESDKMPATTITLNFVEYDGKTKVISEARYSSEEELNQVIEMGMEQGITETWDRLSEHLHALS